MNNPSIDLLNVSVNVILGYVAVAILLLYFEISVLVTALDKFVPV